jgi:hypothetical protein
MGTNPGLSCLPGIIYEYRCYSRLEYPSARDPSGSLVDWSHARRECIEFDLLVFGKGHMKTEVITALIGAFGTVVVAIIGAYATLRTHETAGEPRTGRRNRMILLGIGAVFAAASLMAGYIFGLSHEKQSALVEHQRAVVASLSTYQSLIDSGLTAKKAYIIPAALMLISLDKSRDGRGIDSSRRMIYSLHLLSNVAKSEPNFIEEYHSSYNVDRDPGADPENPIENSPGMKRWQVLFAGTTGERHLVVTGAHVRMPISLDPNHTVHMFSGLGQHEDAFCYPNTDGDIIEEFTIMIESRSLALSLPGQGVRDAILQHGNELRPIDSQEYQTVEGDHKHQVVVARFHNLAKDDVAGLRVQWVP